MDNFVGSCFILESTYRRYREEADIYEVRYLVKNINNPRQKSFFVTGKAKKPELAGSLIHIPDGKIKHHTYGEAYHIYGVDEIELIGNSQSALLKNVIAKVLDVHGVFYTSELLWKECRNHRLSDLDQHLFDSILEAIGMASTDIAVIDVGVASSIAMAALMKSFEKIEPSSILEKDEYASKFSKASWPNSFLKCFENDPIGAAHGRAEISETKGHKKFNVTDELGYQYIDNFFLAIQEVSGREVLNDWFKSGLRPHSITRRFIKDHRSSGNELLKSSDIQKLHAVDVHNAEKILARDGYYIEVNTDDGIVYVPQSIHRQTSQLYELGLRTLRPTQYSSPAGDDLFNLGLDEKQVEAVKAALNPGLSLVSVSGPPGSGKSHLISTIAHLAQGKDSSIRIEDFVFLTPTGTAAARINNDFRRNGWKFRARTIHSLFYGKYRSRDSHKLQTLLEGNETNFGQLDIGRVARNLTNIKTDNDAAVSHLSQVDKFIIEKNVLYGKTVVIDEGTQVSLDVFSALLNLNPSRIILFSDLQQTKSYGLGRPVAGLAQLWKQRRTGSGTLFIELQNDYRAVGPLHEISSSLRKGWLPKVDLVTYKDKDCFVERGNSFRIIEAKENPSEVMQLLADSTYKNAERVSSQEILTTVGFGSKNFIGASEFRFTPDLILGIKNKIVRRINKIMAQRFDGNPFWVAELIKKSILPKITSSDVFPGAVVMQSVNEKAEVKYLTSGRLEMEKGAVASNGERFVLLGYNFNPPLPADAASREDSLLIKNLWARIGIDITDTKYESRNLYQLILEAAHIDAEAAQILLDSCLIEACMIRQDRIRFDKFSQEDLYVYPIFKRPQKDSVQYSIIASCFSPVDAYAGTAEELDEWFDHVEAATLEFGNFKCAFAMNIYKSQGSQSDNVKIILDGVAEGGVKNFAALFYTGVTRAKKDVSVVMLEGESSDLAASYSESHVACQSVSCLDLMIAGKLGVAAESNSVFSIVQPPSEPNAIDVASFAAAEAAIAVGLPSHTFATDPSLAWMTSLTPNMLSPEPADADTGLCNVGNAISRRNHDIQLQTPSLTRNAFVAFQNNALMRSEVKFEKVEANLLPTSGNFKI